MWSLFKKKDGDSEGIFDYATDKSEELPPLMFSNGKSQADVVGEVLDAINSGNKIIFIKGVCGTGKSAIALNLSRHFEKTSIVVPIKSLQHQYEKDYMRKMFILKKNNAPLKISIIKGRNNFHCPYAGGNADAFDLPCWIELREKNMESIRKYIKENPEVDLGNFSSISDVRRMSVAPACSYWSPVFPAEMQSKVLKNVRKRRYMASCGKEFALFKRKMGCGYYDQYDAYVDSDVLIFNSMKYFLETAIGRKPKTDLEIIDECDEFLDNFANERKINLNRLLTAVSNLFPDSNENKRIIKDMIHKINLLLMDDLEDDVVKIKQTSFVPLFDLILENPYLAENEDNNYYNSVFEIIKSFEHLQDETYINFEKILKDDSQMGLFGSSQGDSVIFVNLVSINLAQKFKDIIDKNNVMVLMSGTLHSEQILKDIFGLKEFKVINAETNNPGTILKYRTGMEKNCKYANFASGIVTRKDYLKALDSCIKNAKQPTLVHINAFSDMPTESEIKEYDLKKVISREKLNELNNNKNIEQFKSREIDVLFTTKCSRGVDFPGEVCNSIVLTKYPYPNIQGLFWKILKKEQPSKFMEFYLDKARRELLQKIFRGVRFKGDHVLLLSPDDRVLNAMLK